jgi:TonB family protein
MRNTALIALVCCFVAAPGVATAHQEQEGVVYKPGAGVSAPVVVRQVRPQYTADAMKARIQGAVALECVVEPTGSVGDVKVTRSLDEGLDRESIKAVKLWRFEPGTKDGKPVPVLITLEMTFSLK